MAKRHGGHITPKKSIMSVDACLIAYSRILLYKMYLTPSSYYFFLGRTKGSLPHPPPPPVAWHHSLHPIVKHLPSKNKIKSCVYTPLTAEVKTGQICRALSVSMYSYKHDEQEKKKINCKRPL